MQDLKHFFLNLMMSFSLVLACTACPLFWVKWMRSTPYLENLNMICWTFVLCHSLLFAVEHPLLCPFLAVVDDYLVVCTRGYDALPIIAGSVGNKHQIRISFQTCSECLWFAPYCPCTAWPPACWKLEDESDEPFQCHHVFLHEFLIHILENASTEYQTLQQRLVSSNISIKYNIRCLD